MESNVVNPGVVNPADQSFGSGNPVTTNPSGQSFGSGVAIQLATPGATNPAGQSFGLGDVRQQPGPGPLPFPEQASALSVSGAGAANSLASLPIGAVPVKGPGDTFSPANLDYVPDGATRAAVTPAGAVAAAALGVAGVTAVTGQVGGSDFLASPTQGAALIVLANAGTTGTGAVVRSIAPTITTSLTCPLITGGTGVTSTLILRATSGVGAAGSDIIFQVGTNGSIEAMRISSSGNTGIGAMPTAASRLRVNTGTNRNLSVRSATLLSSGVDMLSTNDADNALAGMEIETSALLLRTPAVGFNIGGAPSAKVHIAAGSAAAGTAPIKLTAGPLMTVPEPGAIEENGTHLYWTDAGGTRRQLDN